MISSRIKELIKKFGIFYLAGFAVILGMKLFYSNADSDNLTWILAPTAWWVRTLSGIAFEYQPHTGYVSHGCRFVIASSCSGIQFMMTLAATLIFSYIHRMNTMKKGWFWMTLCLLGSYILTVFVNGIRIISSIYLPTTLLFHGWQENLGPQRLHTIIGIAVYLTSLFFIYHMAGWLSGKIAVMESKSLGQCQVYQWAPPLFWYFFIVLGIPFLNGAFQKNPGDFAEYAGLVTVVCLFLVSAYCLLSLLKNKLPKKPKG